MAAIWLLLVMAIIGVMIVTVAVVIMTWYYATRGEKLYDALGHAIHSICNW